MAEDKSMKQLKKERTIAKSLFTRQANLVMRDLGNMVQGELLDEFNKLSERLTELFEANDNYMAAILSEELKEEEPQLLEQQEEIEKTARETEEKFKLIRDTVQATLWSKYGENEVLTSIQEAEEIGQKTSDLPVLSLNVESYGVHMDILGKRLKDTSETMLAWERWIPGEERRTLNERIAGIKTLKFKLELRKAEFVTARRAAVEAAEGPTANIGGPATPAPVIPIVRIKPTTLPKYYGDRRDFHRWKKDWENLQRQGEPTGSAEVRKIQLLDSVEDKIVKDLRLSTYSSAEDMFRVLENRYGNKSSIVIEILEDLDKLPPVRGNQPRKVIELIQSVEKALADLTDLDNIGAIKNPLVIKTIESKLPDFVKRDWLGFMLEPNNGVRTDNHFDMLLTFLKKQEGVLERLEQLKVTDKADNNTTRKQEKKYASTKTTKKEFEDTCGVCGEGRHYNRLFLCRKFKSQSVPERKATLKRIGACRICLGWHTEEGDCKNTYVCKSKECKKGSCEHHYLLCPRDINKREVQQRSSDRKSNLTAEQEEFLSELSPDMAERCKKAFTNGNTKMANPTPSKLLEQNGLTELPVILMLMEVTANAGQKIGTLIDLASDTNYITHKAADRLRLRSEKVTLMLYGVGGMTLSVNTKRYLLRVRIKTAPGVERSHELVCYGLDEIAKVHKEVEPQKLHSFFPDVQVKDLQRPREVELLISHREGRLAPQRERVVGDLVLWDGPLGKAVGGAHPDLFEHVEVAARHSETHFARSMRTAAMRYEEVRLEHEGVLPQRSANTVVAAGTAKDFLEWWRWESIGASCEPKCGGCRCGNCQPGGKEMSLGEERELEIIKEGLTYVKEDAHVNAPHWDAKYPWTQDPASLPNNKDAVQATFLRTEKQLSREPEWKAAYTAQVHEMVERQAAIKLTEEMKMRWKGPVWYVSHLVAPNPHSVTTPVRLVWNSSQRFKGQSMNDILLKGPDVLNPIRAVLLRFRQGVHAALGDIKKMYNSVWLEDREMHLHRFLWRDSPEDDIEEYAITRVNIGDRPAGCIAQLAMRETAKLPGFAHLVEERRVLDEDSYVDDILTSHNHLKDLVKITQGVEEILKTGGFFLKPWVWSGQSGRQASPEDVQAEHTAQSKTIILPNQMRDEENKALGVGYETGEDKLYMLASINFSKKKKKMRLGKNLNKAEIKDATPKPLSRRELLSQVAGLYDPIGLVTPLKQKGAILVRRAFQESGGGRMTQETWDKPLSEGLREEAIKLFEEYAELSKIKFLRSITPADWKAKPIAITFSDGSDKTYGAVMYLRWTTAHGAEVRFVEAKAKLTPLDQKGDAVKAEICGAVFAARLRKYFERHARMQVEQWFHLVDSQTVLGAIQRDSYGYQTFFANRVGEIQKAAPVKDWWWIPGDLNIADIITRGSSARDLKEGSTWQNGPDFLKLPVEEWPTKSPTEVAAQVKGSVDQLQRKSFTAVVTRSQSKQNAQENVGLKVKDPADKLRARAPAGWINKLLTVDRFSSLQKLVGTVAWTWRAARAWLRKDLEKDYSPVLTVAERRYALRDLFLAAQEGQTFPDLSLKRLAVYRDTDGLLVCGGRFQTFLEEQAAVPILPFQSWISTLLAREAHNANHDGIAGTLLRMRKKAWVVKGRRHAKRVVDSCVICRKNKAKTCQQIMSDLPPERITPAHPFEYTTVDLFGPFMVKGEVKRRTKLKVWGVVFCCMASRAIQTDIVSDQSSEGFLLAYQRFTALRGHPKKLWSDPGTNFVGARPALKELYGYLDRLNKQELEGRAAKNGTEWSWKIHPANSPHRNGAAEAAVRLVKRALQNLGGNGVYTWSEFQTLLFMAANLVNERPIDAKVQSGEGCSCQLKIIPKSPKTDP